MDIIYKNVKYLGNYDGDTIDLLVEVYPGITIKLDSARLYALDTPELRGSGQKEKDLAIKGKNYVDDLLSDAESIEIKPIKKGKYGRMLVLVWVDGKSLNKLLTDKGYAVPYFGDKKISWKERLDDE